MPRDNQGNERKYKMKIQVDKREGPERWKGSQESIVFRTTVFKKECVSKRRELAESNVERTGNDDWIEFYGGPWWPQLEGKHEVETVTDFIFLGSKITADGDCSHEIKRCLLLGNRAMTNLNSILKSRDITLPTMVHLAKAVFFFSVVMYGCERWTIKTAEHWRTDAL